MKDLWDRLNEESFTLGDEGSVNQALRTSRKAVRVASVWLAGRPVAGTRVAFSGTLEAIFTYPDCPSLGVEGSVVAVRTSLGVTTAQNHRVYVQWDDGKLRAVDRDHLVRPSHRRRTAGAFRKVISGMGDLTAFMQGDQPTELIHKSTQDLWNLRKEGEQYVIERVFDYTGEPLKG